MPRSRTELQQHNLGMWRNVYKASVKCHNELSKPERRKERNWRNDNYAVMQTHGNTHCWKDKLGLFEEKVEQEQTERRNWEHKPIICIHRIAPSDYQHHPCPSMSRICKQFQLGGLDPANWRTKIKSWVEIAADWPIHWRRNLQGIWPIKLTRSETSWVSGFGQTAIWLDWAAKSSVFSILNGFSVTARRLFSALLLG